MTPLNLAIISDLHIGNARSKDLWPNQTRTPDEQKELDRLTDSDYISKFKDFIKRENLKADYLVVPGDISNTAQHTQLELGSKVILDIAQSLKVKAKNILFVPGNHDLDWQIMKIHNSDPTEFYKNLRFSALKDNNLIFNRLMKKLDGSVLNEPWFSVWDNPNLFAIGYNSAWEDGPTAYPHCGSVKQSHVDEIDSYLSSHKSTDSKLKLFLVHHHLFNYSNPDPDFKDFSALENAENLLHILREHKFDFIVHGHKHWPKFTIDYTDRIFPIAVLGAGSFSAQIYSGWQGKVDNQFHLIKVTGRNADNQNIYGKVLSWTYLAAHGWVVSKENNGIEHISPFGCYFEREEVKNTIRSIVQEVFKSDTHITWSNIIPKADHLKHLHTEFRDNILNELESENEMVQ